MALIDEEDHLEFLEKRGFSHYYDPDGSAIFFKVVPRGKFEDTEVKNEEIGVLQSIGRIVHIAAVMGQEEEKEKPYIIVKVTRQKELDLRRPTEEQEQEKKGVEHPEHISD
jgi:hypothetical protein